jgi:hypothetical protein
VFIGQDMDEAQIRSELKACLLTYDEVLRYLSGEEFEDPFPVWQSA